MAPQGLLWSCKTILRTLYEQETRKVMDILSGFLACNKASIMLHYIVPYIST